MHTINNARSEDQIDEIIHGRIFPDSTHMMMISTIFLDTERTLIHASSLFGCHCDDYNAADKPKARRNIRFVNPAQVRPYTPYLNQFIAFEQRVYNKKKILRIPEIALHT